MNSKSTSAHLEIVQLKDEGEWWSAQCAWDGKLCVPFHFHKSARAEFRTEDAFFEYLKRQTWALLEKFGDARLWPFRGERESENGPTGLDS